MASARIALDAFGGDHCPRHEVVGAVEAARAGVRVVLVGDRESLERELAAAAGGESLPISIHHAPERITMDDHPGRAVRAKPDASMPTCFELVRKHEADAVMSAGNSGAMLACGLFKFRRLKGVDRPAIVAALPNVDGFTFVLDVGANVECKPVNFVQFALMGAAYARFKAGCPRPRVAVLSNGSEDGKGTDLTRAVHELLGARSSDDFEYVGYAEGGGLFDGRCDVVVTDGFTGNVALKVAEATGRMVGGWLRKAVTADWRSKLGALVLRGAFGRLRERMNPDSYGAAPLLGVDGVAWLCHGGASARAITIALQQAARSVDQGLTAALADVLTRNAALVEAAKSRGNDGGNGAAAAAKEG
ncbi:MAG: phosphate acyltransferase PlsX [Deltaproteobacteria bacterium]|nr:phosphate acyltransferase PlsX [Deltaproteobacteria bacterium]MBK8720095.1 phosphate acyltransferase PlsX [Deltaproteobacteria bacterium]MBP7289103.1 phosphate acyltransferase PlsX [Nannocystaceae bacterium]